jgi:hypothetical protein
MTLADLKLAPALCLALAACGGQSETASTAEPVVLQTAMLEVVKPQTEVVLNTLIAALTDLPDIHVDPSKLNDSDWAIMQTAAAALRDEAILLRDSPIRITASPDDTLLGQEFPGSLTPEQVQVRIDADPDGFSAHADALRTEAELWLTAIEARDAGTMWRVALELDPVCVECHEAFWEAEHPDEHEDEDHHDHEDEDHYEP